MRIDRVEEEIKEIAYKRGGYEFLLNFIPDYIKKRVVICKLKQEGRKPSQIAVATGLKIRCVEDHYYKFCDCENTPR